MMMQFNFSEEQIKELREEIEKRNKRREEKEQRRQEFNKGRRAEVVQEILSILEKEESVSETAVQHRPKDYPFSVEEFFFIVEPLMHYASVFQLTFLGNENPFGHDCCAVEIKGKTYIFESMHGMGYNIKNYYPSEEKDGTEEKMGAIKGIEPEELWYNMDNEEDRIDHIFDRDMPHHLEEEEEERIPYVLSYETFVKKEEHRSDKNLQTFFERFQSLLKKEEKTLETKELDKDLQVHVEEVLSIQQQLQEKVIALHETFYK